MTRASAPRGLADRTGGISCTDRGRPPLTRCCLPQAATNSQASPKANSDRTRRSPGPSIRAGSRRSEQRRRGGMCEGPIGPRSQHHARVARPAHAPPDQAMSARRPVQRPRSRQMSVPRAAGPGRRRPGNGGHGGRATPSSSKSSISSAIPETTRAWPGKLRRKAWQPALVGASNAPGTRKHSRPCSSAHPAVIRAPLLAPASTTTVASERPLTSRFRRGNVPRLGLVSGASSDTTAPPASTIACARRSWALGNSRACPPPSTPRSDRLRQRPPREQHRLCQPPAPRPPRPRSGQSLSRSTPR